jgi:hypothetical protein
MVTLMFLYGMVWSVFTYDYRIALGVFTIGVVYHCYDFYLSRLQDADMVIESVMTEVTCIIKICKDHDKKMTTRR